MKVWSVTESDCEGIYNYILCSTKEIAERELFKRRDGLVETWKKQHIKLNKRYFEHAKANNIEYEESNFYTKMIENLSGDDYKKWDNFPHSCLYLNEVEIIDK